MGCNVVSICLTQMEGSFLYASWSRQGVRWQELHACFCSYVDITWKKFSELWNFDNFKLFSAWNFCCNVENIEDEKSNNKFNFSLSKNWALEHWKKTAEINNVNLPWFMDSRISFSFEWWQYCEMFNVTAPLLECSKEGHRFLIPGFSSDDVKISEIYGRMT
jgi:hypothetical protein